MKLQHLLDAIQVTAKEYEPSEITLALHGIIARAERYAANDPEPSTREIIKKMIQEELQLCK